MNILRVKTSKPDKMNLDMNILTITIFRLTKQSWTIWYERSAGLNIETFDEMNVEYEQYVSVTTSADKTMIEWVMKRSFCRFQRQQTNTQQDEDDATLCRSSHP